MIRSESIAPDCVAFFDDRDESPELTSYCADPYCAPSTLCDRCRLENGIPCDICGKPATVLEDVDSRFKLPLCATCAAEGAAEDPTGKAESVPFGVDAVDQVGQPFCACGRVASRCDASRKACPKSAKGGAL